MTYEKILYWVDDETRFYPIMKMIKPNEVKLQPYLGINAAQDFWIFFKEFRKNNFEEKLKSSYFLFDLFLPIPETIFKSNKNYELGGKYLADTLISLAEEETKSKLIKNIRILTGYSDEIETPYAILRKNDINLSRNLLDFIK